MGLDISWLDKSFVACNFHHLFSIYMILLIASSIDTYVVNIHLPKYIVRIYALSLLQFVVDIGYSVVS